MRLRPANILGIFWPDIDMAWLQSIDMALYRFLNHSLTNPVFDWLMPMLAGHVLFIPLLLVAGVVLCWKGGRRGRVLTAMLVLVLLLGDTLVCKTIKEVVGRRRPCVALAESLGSPQLKPTDIRDPELLARRLSSQADPVSSWVWSRLSAQTRLELNQATTPANRRLAVLVEELNRLTAGESIYETNRFSAVGLSTETRELLGQQPREAGLVWLNRLLLEDAYPGALAKDHPRCRVGVGASGSMPSSHAANWFAASMIVWLFYRRMWRFIVPMAALVSFSRIYDGVHYPSDVVAGAILGAAYAFVGVWTAESLWRWVGQRWFPCWWRHFPSLLAPERRLADNEWPTGGAVGAQEMAAALESHWLRLGYALIGAVFLLRLGYIASSQIELGKDEAYQWLWSKHLALSYYSKPPMIAYTQWLGTHLWGDTAFGVRFFSPVAGAIMSLLLLRLLAREAKARAGVMLVLACAVTPLLVLGTTLLTVDPLLILFWIAAMVTGWRAVQPGGATRQWLLVGLWTGLSFLSKYSAIYLWMCWGFFFWLWAPARQHLRRPGPYLAVLVTLLCAVPVLWWNAQHGWITMEHVASNGSINKAWQFNPGHTAELLLASAGLLHPVFFVASVWAAIGFWRFQRGQPLPLFFFCMSAPVYLMHLAYTLHSRILPNWIAPCVLPGFCLMAVYWDARWRAGARAVRGWLLGAMILGAMVSAFGLKPELTRKIAGYTLPPRQDPLRRVQGWSTASDLVEAQRRKLEAEGQPAFIICEHYGMTGLFTFYGPKDRSSPAGQPLVYVVSSDHPENQLYFWPEYRYRQTRAGQNAIYVEENDKVAPAPKRMVAEFASVTDLGIFPLEHGGRVTRRLQLWACRNLRPEVKQEPLEPRSHLQP